MKEYTITVNREGIEELMKAYRQESLEMYANWIEKVEPSEKAIYEALYKSIENDTTEGMLERFLLWHLFNYETELKRKNKAFQGD